MYKLYFLLIVPPGIYVSSYFNSRIFVSINCNKYCTFIINAISRRNVNKFYLASRAHENCNNISLYEMVNYITRICDLLPIKCHFPEEKSTRRNNRRSFSLGSLPDRELCHSDLGPWVRRARRAMSAQESRLKSE